MKNKKFIATIASLCLVVVALVAAVVGILAAAQQNVKGTFSVTYVANDVSAIVTLSSQAEKENSYTSTAPSGKAYTHTFAKNDAESTQTLEIDVKQLSVLDSSSVGRYVIYKFDFTNTNTAYGMKIAPTYTATNNNDNKDENVTVKYNWGSEPTISYTTEVANVGGTAITSLTGSTAEHTVAKSSTETLFIIVAISNINADAHYYLGGENQNSLQFVLTRAASNS